MFDLEKLEEPAVNAPLESRLRPDQLEAIREVAAWCKENEKWPKWVGFNSEWERLWPETPVPSHNTIKRLLKKMINEELS